MYCLSWETPLSCRMFGRMRQTKGWEHNGRVLAEDLLVIALDGQAEFTFHDQRHPVHRGDVLYIPANTWYQAYSADYLDYYFFHFCGGRVSAVSEEECRRFKEYEDQLQTASTRAFYLPQTDYHLLIDSQVSLGEQFDHVLYYISKCQGCLVQMDYYKKLQIDLWTSQMLVFLSEYTCAKLFIRPSYPAILRKILLYIQIHYTEPLTLTSLAVRFGVSKSYVARLFRTCLSTTVSAYIHSVKMQHAAEMLKLSALNVSEIAEYLGYSNVYYFSRLFKKYYFVSPSKFA